MLEPTRPNPGRLSEALHSAAVCNLPAAKILAEEVCWQEWANERLQGRCDYRWPNDLEDIKEFFFNGDVLVGATEILDSL